jgi:hypothetical protein
MPPPAHLDLWACLSSQATYWVLSVDSPFGVAGQGRGAGPTADMASGGLPAVSADSSSCALAAVSLLLYLRATGCTVGAGCAPGRWGAFLFEGWGDTIIFVSICAHVLC